MKLWKQQADDSSQAIEQFTTGRDREMDLYLAPYDILGNMAHARMLYKIGLLTEAENGQLQFHLKDMYKMASRNLFSITEGVEDVHSQVEFLLTKNCGDSGKKIHAARSRNDQVLLDIRLFLRDQLHTTAQRSAGLCRKLCALADKHKSDLMPGYTHLQLAMPSSAGLWLGAYAESLTDDILSLQMAYKMVNQNPLGSAAGYGSSFPIDRQMTTELLGFDKMAFNVIYAQMGRGRTERVAAQGLASVAETLGRLAMDCCLFLNQHFGFLRFPEHFTTGSSIMPHKRNPDIWELIRSHCNRLKALPNEIMLITTNLPSGYHRDLQLLKEHLFPAFEQLNNCIAMAEVLLEQMEVKQGLLEDPAYKNLFTVEVVNEKVMQGMPFREAYHEVSEEVKSGRFRYEGKLNHTHKGSMGDLCLPEIQTHLEQLMDGFHYYKVENAYRSLLNPGRENP